LVSNTSKWIAYCSLAIILALQVVGVVSHTSVRHVVQTLPLWFPVVSGLRQRELAKWAALPCLIFWLVIMVLIWLFLLGWARVVAGHFTPVEIAMTLLIGAACVLAIGKSLRWRTAVRPLPALGVIILFGALQFLAFRFSLLPYIARR
jgi:hypothetical protein